MQRRRKGNGRDNIVQRRRKGNGRDDIVQRRRKGNGRDDTVQRHRKGKGRDDIVQRRKTKRTCWEELAATYMTCRFQQAVTRELTVERRKT